jgi:hypothetical protein
MYIFNKWVLYLKSRFPVIPLLIFTQLICLSSEKYISGSISSRGVITGFIFLLFFFYIRLLDEFKDFKYDSVYHKDRPVQSGLIKLSEIKVLLVIVLLTMFLLNAYLRFNGWFLTVILYTFFTYKEFFIKDFYLRYSVLYLVSHELVFIPLYIFFFSNFAGYLYSPVIFSNLVLYTFCVIPVTLVEVGRKMQHRFDSRGNKTTDTYAYLWGEYQTIIVFLCLSALASFLLFVLTQNILGTLLVFIFLVVMVLARNTVVKNKIMQLHMVITIAVSMTLPALLLLL